MKTRFILIDVSHAGNVGAVARAMKVMGFDDLVLVNPRWPGVLDLPETIERASGALDVLRHCRVVPTLTEALHGMNHLCATVMTARDFGPPTRSPREHFELLLKSEWMAQYWRGKTADLPEKAKPPCSTTPPAAAAAGIAFLFGSERFGMSNEAVYRCHVALSIPANPAFGSLNLGAAAQVMAYEWRSTLLQAGIGFEGPGAPRHAAPAAALADAAHIAGLLTHWQAALAEIGYLDPAVPKKLMPRLNQLFNRARLTQEEVHILRGIARQMQRVAARPSQPASKRPPAVPVSGA